jgi:hypothetical protein
MAHDVTQQEAATLIDRFLQGSVGPHDWDDFISTRHRDPIVERASRMCTALDKLHPSEIKGHYCNASGFKLLQTLAIGLRDSSLSVQLRAGDILASALEADAALQETGDVRQVGAAQERTWVQVVAIAPDYSDAVGFAFRFWDEWTDAANHEWQYHDPITRSDWPRYARVIAEGLRRGRLPDDDRLLGLITLKPRRTFRQWLSGLFGRAV